jgi:hypothetical protein
MTLTSGTIPNFINGVSQQAPALRLSSQAEEQINGFSTIVDGLKKRPSSRHLARLMDAPAGPVFAHLINRDATERYVKVSWNGDLKVFDLTGAEKTVAFPDGKTYLNNASPNLRFAAVTVADYTFFLNKDAVVAMHPTSKSPARPFEALVNVKQGNYGKYYTVTVNGSIAANYQTPTGESAAHSPYIDTTTIATVLNDEMVTALGVDWTIQRYYNVVYLSRSTDFTITMADGFNGNAASVAKGTIQHFSDLPLKGPEGYVVEVVGDNTTQFDNYWVTLGAAGVWKETVKPDTPWELLKTSMPYALIREADGTFTFKAVDWAKRLVGDAKSSEDPSFVGKKITDIFFHRNRLGLLSDENVVFSQAGEYFNFWRTTVTAVLDDAPIDVGNSHTKVSILRHAVPFRDNLVLFSDQTQFSLHAQNILTPKTVSITPTTELPCTRYAKPVATGDSVFFLDDGASIRMYEYRLDPVSQALTGEEVTRHVPRYIPGGFPHSSVSSKHDMLFVTSSAKPERIYVYQWTWSGEAKLQSAFHYWDLGAGAEILAHDCIDSDIILVVKRDGAVWLEAINIDPAKTDASLSYWQCLDRRVHSDTLAAPVYDATADRTAYTLPYTVPAAIKASVAADSGGVFAGMSMDVDSYAGQVVRLKGNTSAIKLYFGLPYRFRYRLSPILAKKQGRTGEQIIADARLQLRYLSLVYGPNTADLLVEVSSPGRSPYQSVISGYVLGAMQTDKPPLGPGGVARVPIMTRSDTCTIDFISDSHLPSAMISAEWEGLLHMKARPGN